MGIFCSTGSSSITIFERPLANFVKHCYCFNVLKFENLKIWKNRNMLDWNNYISIFRFTQSDSRNSHTWNNFWIKRQMKNFLIQNSCTVLREAKCGKILDAQ